MRGHQHKEAAKGTTFLATKGLQAGAYQRNPGLSTAPRSTTAHSIYRDCCVGNVTNLQLGWPLTATGSLGAASFRYANTIRLFLSRPAQVALLNARHLPRRLRPGSGMTFFDLPSS